MVGIIRRGTLDKKSSGLPNRSWLSLSAPLALAALLVATEHCDGQTPPSSNGCYASTTADGGAACECFGNSTATPGMFVDGGCVPSNNGGSSSGPVSCPADPNPTCVPQNTSKQLEADAGANSTLVIGDYTVTLQNTSVTNSTFTASVSVTDFCNNLLQSQPINLGASAIFTVDNGNIVINVNVSAVDPSAMQSATLNATMSCPNYVQTDAGVLTGAVCPMAMPDSAGGLLYLGSLEKVGGYGFTYAGDNGGFANIIVTCNGANLAALQCTVNSPTVLARPSDNGGLGFHITITPSSAEMDYADVSINVGN